MGYTHCKDNEPVFRGITCPYTVGTQNLGQTDRKIVMSQKSVVTSL
jgi:hypothetical protein